MGGLIKKKPLVNNGQNWCQKLCNIFCPYTSFRGSVRKDHYNLIVSFITHSLVSCLPTATQNFVTSFLQWAADSTVSDESRVPPQNGCGGGGGLVTMVQTRLSRLDFGTILDPLKSNV